MSEWAPKTPPVEECGLILCIGGPRDGLRIVLNDYCVFRGYVQLLPRPRFAFDDSDLTYTTAWYRLEKITCTDRVFNILVHDGMTCEEAFMRLFDRYPTEPQ
jgi:hypothetical protein